MTKLTTSDHSKTATIPVSLNCRLPAHAAALGKPNPAKRRVDEDRGQQHAGRAAHAMHGEHVERVVDLEAPLHHADHEVADGAAGKADDERSARARHSLTRA